MVDWEAFYGAFRQPDFIAGYEIQNHLGGGAFGEVYKAKKRSIGKSYAIKFLKLEGESESGGAERELEQVRLFASIDHPNLVTIEDMGLALGVPYLIMGYAGEDTLARRLKRGDLERASALRYFVQACRGVLALHDRRLAHFDIKPSNVFIKGDVARVGDYGLAKLLSEGRQTLSFGRGTPLYMAPEMMRNRADYRADVYSLGILLFETLTGRLPYGNREQPGVLVRETDEAPEFPADFPADLRGVVERALRLDPDDRHASVHELLEDLGQTSRQGDSVRIPWSELAGSKVPVPAEESGTPRAGGEFKQAAVELARGAVGVARGVWDGVLGGERKRGAASTPSPTSKAPDEPASGVPEDLLDRPDGDTAESDDIVSFQALTQTEEVVAAPDLVPAPAPRSAPVAKTDSAAHGSALLAGSALFVTAPYGPGPAGTVPVPPRAEGGLFGTLLASLALGAEILGALVSGPVLVVLRGTGHVVDRAVRGVPGFLGASLRLFLFLVMLACLGGLVAFGVLFLATV